MAVCKLVCVLVQPHDECRQKAFASANGTADLGATSQISANESFKLIQARQTCHHVGLYHRAPPSNAAASKSGQLLFQALISPVSPSHESC